MSECRGNEYQKLPPGWDCKVDKATGKCYYINYITKAMQLEDPRKRYKQLQNERCSTESIPMQPLHGSPYHVYPASSYPAVKAFQGPQPSLQNVSASPLLSTKSQTGVEMSPIFRSASPQTPRMSHLSRRQTIQETSFTNPIDTDAVVAKINNMFPTASETHIRLLLKKYYNREAVVISALQVEKHPVTMPGPFVTPPAQRHLFHSNSSMYQMTPPAPSRRFDAILTSSRTNSPIPGRPNSVTSSGLYGSPRFSPKPHSSPKMKLRYMKSIFPKADETLLLDILANSDNNVQSASEKLISMGYKKRDVLAAPKLSSRAEEHRKYEEKTKAAEKIIPLRPKVFTTEEKESMKQTLQNRYNTIAERIILMALESVNYSEDRASQILQIVLQEDESKAKQKSRESNASKSDDTAQEQPETISESRTNDSPKTCETALASIAVTARKSTSSLSKLLHRSTSRASSLAHLSRDGRLESTITASTLLSPGSVRNTDDDHHDDEKKPISKKCEAVEIAVFEPEHIISTDPEETLQSVPQKFASPSSPSPSSSASPKQSSALTSSSPCDTSTTITPNDDSKKTRSIAKFDLIKTTPKTSIDENITPTKSEFQSIVKRICAQGANPELCHGPNEDLLLADYITWNGANPDISVGQKSIAQGSDPTLLTDRTRSSSACSPRGRNRELCKGPQVGLAKGSIYSQINRSIATNVKCN